MQIPLNGRAVPLVVAFLVCSWQPTATCQFVPSGLLEIHQINVQQGDCTLIIGPDGTTFLIDAGRPGKGSAEVVPYLQSLGLQPSDGLDYMLATHRDSDHLGGLDEVIDAGYDVRFNVWDNGSNKSTNEVDEFLQAALTTTAGAVQMAPLGGIVLLGGGATARIVAVDGEVLGYGHVSGTSNENDKSVAVLVQYLDFDYLTAGDLGGGSWNVDKNCTGRHTNQKNVETPLATALMPGGGIGLLTVDGVEIVDVNHHGSESSTNHEYMNLMSPRIAIINVGAGQGGSFQHPRKDVVENVLLAQGSCLTAAPALVLQTEEGAPTGAETSFAGYCVGDVAITTSGLDSFTVSATGQVSQGPDERAGAGINGVGTSFPMDGESDTESPVVTLAAPNGAESWDSGTTQNIIWTATDNIGVTSVDLFYSTTGAGGPFGTIATGETNDGVYPWVVPNDPSTNAFVKVVAYDAASNSGQDASDGPFTLTGTTPSVDLVINEIMQNPDFSSDTYGEWFELYNAGTSAVDIDGWTIRDDDLDAHVIQNGGPLLVPAGGFLVLGRSGETGSNGGYVSDYVYNGFILANGDDEVVLQDPSVTIVDSVSYTGVAPWPNPTGRSMELTDPSLDNDLGGNWVEAIARGGTFDAEGADLGTPGAQNSEGGQGSELHVHGLTVENAQFGGNRWAGQAMVTVHDENHVAVAGVLVTGDWSGIVGQTGDTGTTDGSGVALVESKKKKNPSGQFCFDVTDLALSGFSYDAATDAPQTPPAVCGPTLP
jgi:beta-lactamase superfamily II metal-dependent hydrolase